MFNFLITYICILVAIAFYTLIERKLLAYIQLRKGPNKTGIIGVGQPFADAIKLFSKSQVIPYSRFNLIFIFTPFVALALRILLWSMAPSQYHLYNNFFGILSFLIVSRFNVFVVIAAGWSRNSKYASLGMFRGIAQTISYEIALSTLFVLRCVLKSSYSLNRTFFFRYSIIFIIPLLLPIWLICLLAETNRSPFDLVEGESELVSGFNIEYRGGGFALIFIAEYTRILAISIVISALLTYNIINLFFVFKLVILSLFVLWIRGVLPRVRYDNFIYLLWLSCLPIILAYFIFILLFLLIIN